MVKRRMSEGAKREELSPYARLAPPWRYNIKYNMYKGFIKLLHHFYVVCLLDCTVSCLSSAQKSVSESIWAAKSNELWGRKFEYAAQILSLTDSRAKERLIAVYMSFSVCKRFCCFLTGWIKGTILLAIMNYLLRCLDDLAMELIVGKIMYKLDKQCKFYILGQGSTYLSIH